MLLAKVDTFEKAAEIVKNEEQATSDSKKCSATTKEFTDVNATSGYRRAQNEKRVQFHSSSKPAQASSGFTRHETETPGPSYVCIRCCKRGHWASHCGAKHMDCRACGKIGHFAKACHTRNWDEHATPAQAMSCKAYNVRIDEEGKQSLEDARL